MKKENNTITFSVEEMKKKAISAMEECMAYMTVGNIKDAIRERGEAAVWEELLYNKFDIDISTENEHYEAMYNIWINKLKKIEATIKE